MDGISVGVWIALAALVISAGTTITTTIASRGRIDQEYVETLEGRVRDLENQVTKLTAEIANRDTRIQQLLSDNTSLMRRLLQLDGGGKG